MRDLLLSRCAAICACLLACVLAASELAPLALACTGSCSGDVSNSCLELAFNPCTGMYAGCFRYSDPCGPTWPYAQATFPTGNWYVCGVSGSGTQTCSWTMAPCATIQQYTDADCMTKSAAKPVTVSACIGSGARCN